MGGFSINRVTVSGNLTRDPEVRSLPSGTALCKLGIAVNERVKDQAGNWSDRPNFFDVVVWGGIGDWIGRELHKGDGIVIEGRLRYRTWETNEGAKRSAVEIVGESVVPLQRGQRSGSTSAAGNSSSAGAAGPEPAYVSGGQMPDDDEIPF